MQDCCGVWLKLFKSEVEGNDHVLQLPSCCDSDYEVVRRITFIQEVLKDLVD